MGTGVVWLVGWVWQVEARLPVTNLMRLDVSPSDLKDIGGVPDTGPVPSGLYTSQADADTAALQVGRTGTNAHADSRHRSLATPIACVVVVIDHSASLGTPGVLPLPHLPSTPTTSRVGRSRGGQQL